MDAYGLIQNLYDDGARTIAAGSCNRFGCYETTYVFPVTILPPRYLLMTGHSGVYVCNDNDSELSVLDSDAAGFADLVSTACSIAGDDGAHGISGQAFAANGGGFVGAHRVVRTCDNTNAVDVYIECGPRILRYERCP